MLAEKILTAALLAATLAVATAGTAMAGPPPPPPPPPHHHHHPDWAWGAGGLAAGLVIGSAMAASAAPVDDEPVRHCYLVERVDRWGEIVTRRICRYE